MKKGLQKAGHSVGVLIPFLEVPSWRHLEKKKPEKIIFCGGFLHHWSYHIHHLVHGSKISVPKNSLLRYYHDWSRRFGVVSPIFFHELKPFETIF